MIILGAFILLLFTFYLIAKVCDRYFVESLEIIIKRLKISNDVAGASFMAIGSSAPELFIAIIALTKVGIENVGAGTIVGSAIFNILVIIGAAAIAREILVEHKSVIRDITFYISTIIILLFTFWDGVITLQESFWYVGFYVLYLIILSRWHLWVPREKEVVLPPEKKESSSKKKFPPRGFLRFDAFSEKIMDYSFPRLEKNPNLYGISFLIAVLYISVLSWVMVDLAVFISRGLGISEALIALIVLAAGTSIPDLISSVIAAKKGYGNMAVSNAIGSNTFDILIGLGAPWMVYILIKDHSIEVGNENILSSIILLFGTVILLALILIGKKFSITRNEGFLLIGVYLLYVAFSIVLIFRPDLAEMIKF